jgi:hypothetical protein
MVEGSRMPSSLYEMFDEIDEEMVFVLECVSAIRELVEKGQKKKALAALVELEDELEDFLTFPEDWEEEEEEEEEDEEEEEKETSSKEDEDV